MRCSRVKHLIEDHVDGLLAAPEAERVRLHLDDCADCAGEAEASRVASASLAAWDDLEPPAGCFDAILGRIDTLPAEALQRQAEPRLHFLRGSAFRWIASGAVAAATFLIGLNITLHGTGAQPIRVVPPPTVVNYATNSGERVPDSASAAAEERIAREQSNWIEEDGLSRRRIYVPAFPAVPVISASFAPGVPTPR